MIFEAKNNQTWGHITGLLTVPDPHDARIPSRCHCLLSRSQDTCELVLGIVGIHLVIIWRNDGDILHACVLNSLQ